MSNGYVSAPPKSFYRGHAFCLDTGGAGSISSKIRWFEAGVTRPLGSHGWFHVRGLAWFGFQVDPKAGRGWLSRAGFGHHRAMPPHSEATQPRAVRPSLCSPLQPNPLVPSAGAMRGPCASGALDPRAKSKPVDALWQPKRDQVQSGTTSFCILPACAVRSAQER